jgi:cyclopropane-fatty-acyl-phospholipid synthase
MASQRDLEFTYSTIDQIFRLSPGQTAHYSGAMYQGDFSLSLEATQRQKHDFIAQSLCITGRSRILDLGCGWGHS